jgi:hypothetical protein
MMLLAARGCGDYDLAMGCQAEKIRIQALIDKTGDEGTYPSDDISMGAEKFKVPWVNETGDGVVMESRWSYITRPIETRRTAIKWFKSFSGPKPLKPWDYSSSKGTGAQSGTCDRINTNVLLKTANCMVGRDYGMDCNFLCPCAEMGSRRVNTATGQAVSLPCSNQFLHEGLQCRVEVFRCTDGRGWGVRTPKGVTIPANTVVGTYNGFYQREEDMPMLEQLYADQEKMSFIMNLGSSKNAKIKDKDKDKAKDQYAIDATDVKSVTAFFNHTCEAPNLEIKSGLRNHMDVSMCYRYFVSKGDIPELTELCFNYGIGSKGIECPCEECGKDHCLCVPCMTRHRCKKLSKFR